MYGGIKKIAKRVHKPGMGGNSKRGMLGDRVRSVRNPEAAYPARSLPGYRRRARRRARRRWFGLF